MKTIVIQTDNRSPKDGTFLSYSVDSVRKLALDQGVEYEFVVHKERGTFNSTRMKHRLARQAFLDGYDNVLLIDTDVICVKRFSIPVVFGLVKNLGICQDIMGINSGVIFYKNTEYCNNLIEDILATKRPPMDRHPETKKLQYTHDQGTMNRFLLESSQYAYNFTLLNSNRFNAQLKTIHYKTPEYYWYDYIKGRTFLLHLAGLPNEKRLEYCKKFLK